MKTPLLLAAMLLCSLPAAAAPQSSQVVRHGLYRLPAGKIAAAQGRLHILPSQAAFVRTTDQPPARMGTVFGYEFLVAGLSPGDRDGWWVVILHPPMKRPGAAPASRTSFATEPKLTEKGFSGMVLYGVDQPYEVLPGRWILQLTHRGQVVVEKSFTVTPVVEEGPTAAGSIRKACAQELGLFCNGSGEDLPAAVRCLKGQPDSLLPPCRQALGL